MSHFQSSPGQCVVGKRQPGKQRARNAGVSCGGIRANLQLNRLLVRMLAMNSVRVVSISRCTVRIEAIAVEKAELVTKTELVSVAYHTI